MREELKQYGDEAYSLVETIANDIGPRIPGSENEKKLHNFMADKLKGIGLNPITESFIFAPYGSIGGLPMAGWAGIIGMAALLIGLILAQFVPAGGFAVLCAASAYMIGLWIWLVCSVFKYKTWFDWAFKHAKSHNTYAELVPEDGEYDYTIYLSGHTDTSWCLKLSASQYKMGFVGTIIKLATGAICVGLITLLVFAGFILTCGQVDDPAKFAEANRTFLIVCGVAAPILIVGAFFLTMYNERSEAMASPGAMDNATGIAIAYETIKYFKENPDKMPPRCRIIDANIGAEESGLRGSIAFTRRHKNDGMLNHAYHINIDSVADKDYFEVIHGDSWLCPRFDKGLKKDFMIAMKEAGIEKPGDIANPVGGCDSTPFQKAGVKSITFAAQNPIMSNYYHTYLDVPERFDAETVGLGLDVVLRVIDRIGRKEVIKAKHLAEKQEQEVAAESAKEKIEDMMKEEVEESKIETPAAVVETSTQEEPKEEPKEEIQEQEAVQEEKTAEAVEEEPKQESAKEEAVEENASEEKIEESQNKEDAEEKIEDQEAVQEKPEEKAEDVEEESAKEEQPAEDSSNEDAKSDEPAKEEKEAEEPKKLKTTCPNCKTKIIFTEADLKMTCPNCGKSYRNSLYSGFKK